MRIAVIGAGHWGKNLVKGFAELGVLAAVADPLPENREWVAAGYPDAAAFEDGLALLGAGGIDAVAIATPAATHFPLAREAMERGLDAFVEKPFTLDVGEAEELCRIAAKTGRILMVGHLLLYQPAIGFIKDSLDEGMLGRVFSMHQRRSKLGRVRSVENVLWSFGVHDVAVLLHLAGQEPEEIRFSGHAGINPTIEDDTYLHLRFPSGVVANLHNSWFWPRVERELIVTGEKGMLVFDELRSRVILHRKTVDLELRHHDGGEEVVFEGAASPLRLELGHFLDCCQTRRGPLSGAESGLACVKVLAAAGGELMPAR